MSSPWIWKSIRSAMELLARWKDRVREVPSARGAVLRASSSISMLTDQRAERNERRAGPAG
jgi:hypothetical protein